MEGEKTRRDRPRHAGGIVAPPLWMVNSDRLQVAKDYIHPTLTSARNLGGLRAQICLLDMLLVEGNEKCPETCFVVDQKHIDDIFDPIVMNFTLQCG